MKDLVVGIDSSTQSTKAIAWTKAGEFVAEGRCAIDLLNPRLFWFEQNSRDWWNSCRTALRQLTQQVDPARIAGMAISNQRETVFPVDVVGTKTMNA